MHTIRYWLSIVCNSANDGCALQAPSRHCVVIRPQTERKRPWRWAWQEWAEACCTVTIAPPQWPGLPPPPHRPRLSGSTRPVSDATLVIARQTSLERAALPPRPATRRPAILLRSSVALVCGLQRREPRPRDFPRETLLTFQQVDWGGEGGTTGLTADSWPILNYFCLSVIT